MFEIRPSAFALVAAGLMLTACPGGDPIDPTASGSDGTTGGPGGDSDTTGSGPTTADDPTTGGTGPGETTVIDPSQGNTTDGGTTEGTSDGTTTTTGPDTDTDTGQTPDPVGIPVHLVPQAGVMGMTRINFAVPLPRGQLEDEGLVQVVVDGQEVAAGRRGLAKHADGSWRSVQVQLDLTVTGEADIEVVIGAAPTVAALDLLPVEDTLLDAQSGPRVWALLPAQWLADSGLAGPLNTEAAVEGTPLGAWTELCDYASWDVDVFLDEIAKPDVWLYDRATIFYRGHARRGDLVTLRTAYLEATIYRDGIVGEGANTMIAVPGKNGDAKYYYAQNLAMHYLMTGDDRFRESAETMALAFDGLWSPGYDGGSDFWTERHAGFGLLAYVWAMNVSDDKAEQLRDLADEAVTAYLEIQSTYPQGYADADARCFAHHGDAAGEPYAYFGCSPWLSAILAEALEQYATEAGGAEADAARASVVQLGKIIARDGLDAGGKPYYWMSASGDMVGEPDEFDEHWGESAYVVAMAWRLDGAQDDALKAVADGLVDGLAANGSTPHMRSFNWQCRSAVAAPWFLSP